MAGKKWSQEQIDFVVTSANEGKTLADVQKLVEEKFQVVRSIASLKLVVANSKKVK